MTNFANTAEILLGGGVALIPTDTIYGLVARAFDKMSVYKVYELKNRDPSKPSIVLVADISDLNLFGIDKKWINKINEFWPGPNSLVFPTTKADIEHLTKGTGTIALRLPADDDLRNLLRQTGPLIAPSANPEGLPPATNIAEAQAYFGNQVDIYIDGGSKSSVAASHLVNLTNDKTLR